MERGAQYQPLNYLHQSHLAFRFLALGRRLRFQVHGQWDSAQLLARVGGKGIVDLVPVSIGEAFSELGIQQYTYAAGDQKQAKGPACIWPRL